MFHGVLNGSPLPLGVVVGGPVIRGGHGGRKALCRIVRSRRIEDAGGVLPAGESVALTAAQDLCQAEIRRDLVLIDPVIDRRRVVVYLRTVVHFVLDPAGFGLGDQEDLVAAGEELVPVEVDGILDGRGVEGQTAVVTRPGDEYLALLDEVQVRVGLLCPEDMIRLIIVDRVVGGGDLELVPAVVPGGLLPGLQVHGDQPEPLGGQARRVGEIKFNGGVGLVSHTDHRIAVAGAPQGQLDGEYLRVPAEQAADGGQVGAHLRVEAHLHIHGPRGL